MKRKKSRQNDGKATDAPAAKKLMDGNIKQSSSFIALSAAAPDIPGFVVTRPQQGRHMQFPGRNDNISVHVLFNGASICVFGACSIHCIAGGVTINGYEFRSNKDAELQICAPFYSRKPCLIEGFTQSQASKVPYRTSQIKYKLNEFTEQANEIMQISGDQTPAILIINRRISCIARTLQNFAPNFLIPTYRYGKQSDRCLIYDKDHYEPYVIASQEQILNRLQRVNQRRFNSLRTVVMVVGGKGAGKSNLLRFVLNRSLNEQLPPLYVLDGDVGQSEFTPAGCLSLWKVTKPILDVPWCHQVSEFEETYFFGSIQADHGTDRYLRIVDHLVNHFNTKSEPGSLLFVNTMGWIEGTGKTILDHIVDVVQPFFCFSLPQYKGTATHLYQNNKVDMSVVAWKNPTGGPYVPEMLRLERQNIPTFEMRPAQLRELNIISYFGSKLPRPSLNAFTEIPPYSVDFQQVTFAIPEDYSYIDDKYLLSSLNAQLVALCSISQEYSTTFESATRHVLDRKYLPKVTLIKDGSPLLMCRGYGYIRGIDLHAKKIYLVTPVSPQTLSKVSIFARGTDLFIPPTILRSQNQIISPYVARPKADRGRMVVNDLFSSLRNAHPGARGHYPNIK